MNKRPTIVTDEQTIKAFIPASWFHPIGIFKVLARFWDRLAVFEEYPELKDGKVKLDGDNVIEFPKLPELQQVTLKVLRWEERDKRLIIKEAVMLN